MPSQRADGVLIRVNLILRVNSTNATLIKTPSGIG